MEMRFCFMIVDSIWILSAIILLASVVNGNGEYKNAYATMMYMGTPRDYEFYVATRVMLRSLSNLGVQADLVVIASVDVPLPWIQTLEAEDGAKVVRVENLKNPYGVKDRFKLTLNKVYAWSLVKYERVVMLDSDNIFLRNTDELFQCGEFCAVFINPCIFHTGLFVLQPSIEVFEEMIDGVEKGRENPDGADQGFIGSYFVDLLDQPLYHPPLNNSTRLLGTYRLPLGYQMDASYFYLKLRWSVPCGPNSVITFPSAPWLKPWYWWSWPVLPLGIQWHEQRLQTIGYGAEILVVTIQSLIYIGIIIISHLAARPNLSKLCHRRSEKTILIFQSSLKILAMSSIIVAYMAPFFIIPRTIHPLLGWSLYLLGVLALLSITVNTFVIPMLSVFTLWLGIIGVLFVMAFPWYNDGIIRALSVFGYAFCCAPFVWCSFNRIFSSLQVFVEREALLPRLADSSTPPGFNKLY